jgi:hypothetical protein
MRLFSLIRILNSLAYFPGVFGVRAWSRTERGRELVDAFADRFEWYALLARPLCGSIAAALALLSPYWLMHAPFLAFVFFTAPARAAQVLIAHVPLWLLLTVLAGLVELVAIVRDIHESADGQRRIAGHRAEVQVRRLVRQLARQLQARDLHNVLLVVNRGQPDEFSMEIDHLLITRHNVFVVETKYKAGRVLVDEAAPEWKVEGARSGSMRNALLQAKNTCRQLRRHLNTSVAPIPVVVISSAQGTTVVSPVSNVVTPDGLADVITALDQNAPAGDLDSGALLARIAETVDRSAFARRAHNARANAARRRQEEDTIRHRASL